MEPKATKKRAAKKYKLPTRLESAEQADLVLRAKLHVKLYPTLDMLYAIPNGEEREHKTRTNKFGEVSRFSPAGAKLQAQGVRPGIPDLCVAAARRGYFGLYIEMKRTGEPNNRAAQLERQATLRDEGYLVCICWNADEAWNVLVWYATGKRTGSFYAEPVPDPLPPAAQARLEF